MRLSQLHTGDRAIIIDHTATGAFRKRMLEMGFVAGKEILVVKSAPLQDPIQYRLLNYDVSLRRQEAETIEVRLLHEGSESLEVSTVALSHETTVAGDSGATPSKAKKIKVAFVGNPNCGKTSVFNAASGANEHVGNYSGVTVEAKHTHYHQDGYDFELVDLPGTYSLSSYSPEEIYVAEYLLGTNQPDVIINVVDSSNLERNLYMSTQLIETGLPMVMALNMYDELERSGSQLNVPLLTQLLGVPMCATVGRTGKGVKELFRQVITIFEHRSDERRIVEVRYDEAIEQRVSFLKQEIDQHISEAPQSLKRMRSRYLAIKLLEGDKAVSESLTAGVAKGGYLVTKARFEVQQHDKSAQRDFQSHITDSRYGFVSGALQETLRANFSGLVDRNRKIDHILTHKIWGLPIFVVLMYIMFQATFTLGAYPMEWIEAGVEWLGSLISSMMPDGMLKDLLVDGVIGGVGGVIVFLPNIVILYLFIAIMEDTGYMARAAFIMDRLMHLIGLHGKSFIPLVMGFGCNVPAVMATRTIESRNSRLLTMLILPFMSCSARLPVYLLLVGAFMPAYAGTVLFGLYFLGILLAVLSALVFKRLLFAHDDTPFVMELPPYRVPTPISVLLHMWTRSKQYLNKMGSVILLASIVIWALGYFPRESAPQVTAPTSEVVAMQPEESEAQANMSQQEHSYIGQIGHTIQPLFEPLGFDWRMSVALLTGAAAKEIVVSTMGVLYTGNAEDEILLSDKLISAQKPDGTPVYTPLIALAFMVFVLVYFPCIATIVAIGRESGSAKWALFSTLYSCALAWVVSWLVIAVGGAFV